MKSDGIGQTINHFSLRVDTNASEAHIFFTKNINVLGQHIYQISRTL